MKSGLYQQPVVGSYLNFKLRLLGSNKDDLEQKTTSKYEKWSISATTAADRILLKFETEAIGINSECIKASNKYNLQWKTISKYEK
jgi:hypothetical protein